METIRTQTVADAIATRIEKLILEGALRPGEKLASERNLAQRLDVSRPSLRQAIDKLVERGLLTATRGGTSVAQFLLPIMTPLANLYRDHQNAAADYLEFRQWVEAQAARAAAERATEVDKGAIRDCLADMRKAHRSKEPTQEAQADVNLHLLVYEASHNFIVLHVMRALSELFRDGHANRTVLIFSRNANERPCPGQLEAVLGQPLEPSSQNCQRSPPSKPRGEKPTTGAGDGPKSFGSEGLEIARATMPATKVPVDTARSRCNVTTLSWSWNCGSPSLRSP